MSKTNSEIAHEIAQDCISKVPVLILGSGASAAYGIPGMPGLRDHLLSTSLPKSASCEDQSAWDKFHDSLLKSDLETSLMDCRFSDSITQHIADNTWDFLAPYDVKVFEAMLKNRNIFPLTKLYQHLLRSTRSDIHVVTPNYDRIAEYAADAGELSHYTGFSYGHLRFRSNELTPLKSSARVVKVWKVHGSFDWFKDDDGVVMALPVFDSRPSGVEPVIVTPGIEKYRRTHDEPFLSIKQGADLALQSAGSYLCIGYGFNDKHLQTKLVERCRVESVPLVLITKEITPTAHDFLKSGKCPRYLALEAFGSGSKMYSAEYSDGVELENCSVWQLEQFLNMVI
ncbi:MAG: SIR2 family protein [Methylobacter sp.]